MLIETDAKWCSLEHQVKKQLPGIQFIQQVSQLQTNLTVVVSRLHL